MTVRVLRYEPDYEVVPQAIIWRPLRYFTLIIRNGEDGLDEFKGASFRSAMIFASTCAFIEDIPIRKLPPRFTCRRRLARKSASRRSSTLSYRRWSSRSPPSLGAAVKLSNLENWTGPRLIGYARRKRVSSFSK